MKRECIIDGTKKGQTLPVDNLVVMQVLAAQQDLEIDVKSFDFWVILIFSEIWETSALIITDVAKQTWWTKYLDSGSVIAFRLLCSSIKLLFLIKCSCEAETERLLYIGFLAKLCKCAPAKLKDNVDKVGILEVAEELHQMCVWHCLVKSERFEGKNCPKASTGQTWSPGTSSPSGGSWSRATLAQSCPPSPKGEIFYWIQLFSSSCIPRLLPNPWAHSTLQILPENLGVKNTFR